MTSTLNKNLNLLRLKLSLVATGDDETLVPLPGGPADEAVGLRKRLVNKGEEGVVVEGITGVTLPPVVVLTSAEAATVSRPSSLETSMLS